MYIDSIVFPIIASVPDEIVQHFAGIDLLWIFYEKIELVIFVGGQRKFDSVNSNFSRIRI